MTGMAMLAALAPVFSQVEAIPPPGFPPTRIVKVTSSGLVPVQLSAGRLPSGSSETFYLREAVIPRMPKVKIMVVGMTDHSLPNARQSQPASPRPLRKSHSKKRLAIDPAAKEQEIIRSALKNAKAGPNEVKESSLPPVPSPEVQKVVPEKPPQTETTAGKPSVQAAPSSEPMPTQVEGSPSTTPGENVSPENAPAPAVSGSPNQEGSSSEAAAPPDKAEPPSGAALTTSPGSSPAQGDNSASSPAAANGPSEVTPADANESNDASVAPVSNSRSSEGSSTASSPAGEAPAATKDSATAPQ